MMNNKKANNESAVLPRIGKIFASRWYLCLLFGLIVGLIIATYTNFTFTPMYKATSAFYVEVRDENGKNDVEAAAALAKTYALVLKNDYAFCSDVNEMATTKYSARNVSEMMDCRQMEEGTPTVQIAFTAPSPAVAYNLTFATRLLAEDRLRLIDENVSIKVFCEPEYTTDVVNENNSIRNGAIGFAAGFVLLFVIFAAVGLRDHRVLSEADIAFDEDIPVLGAVPTIKKLRGRR